MLLWGLCPWLLHAALPIPLLSSCSVSTGVGCLAGEWALNWHRAFLGAALLCRQPWLGEGCHVLPAVPRGMLGLAGLCWQARLLVLVLLPSQEHPAPVWHPEAGLCRWAALFPPFLPSQCMLCSSLSQPCSDFPACVAQRRCGTNTAAPFPVSCFHLFRQRTSLLCWQPVGLHKQCKTKPRAGVGPARVITGSMLLLVGREPEPPFPWSCLAALRLHKGSGLGSATPWSSSLLPIA